MQNSNSFILGLTPVFIGIGILIHVIDINLIGYDFYSLVVFLIFINFNIKATLLKKINILLFWALCVALGWLSMQYRLDNIKNIHISEYQGLIEGDVIEISYKNNKIKTLLRNVIMTDRDNLELSGVLLNIDHKSTEVKVGDRIQLMARLNPIDQDHLPSTFDYYFYLYLKEINAKGISLSNVKIIKTQNLTFINKIRQKINYSFYKFLPKESADIAVAFFLGNTKNISKSIFENIRIVGLAHLLAISGMHIALFSGMIFMSCKFILRSVSKQIININKISAVITAVFCFFYLILAQAPISAQRAYMMTLLLLIGVIIDRKTHPQRTITIAATIILLCSPDALLFPAFQMSFAASIGLICGFIMLKNKNWQEYIIKFGRFKVYFITIVISSIIATITTSLYILYHFKNFSTYATIANLAAIPITEFLIMPFGLLGIILLPFNLEFLGYYAMDWGIKILLLISENIAKFSYAEVKIKHIPTDCLVFFSLGLAYLIIIPGRFKKYCLIFFIISTIDYITYKDPDLVINNNSQLIAVKDIHDGKLFFIRNTKNYFMKKIWQENMHFKKISKKHLQQYCKKDICYFNEHKLFILLTKKALQDLDGIDPGAISLINLTNENVFNKDNFRFYLDINNLKDKGTHKIWLSNKKIKIENSRSRFN